MLLHFQITKSENLENSNKILGKTPTIINDNNHTIKVVPKANPTNCSYLTGKALKDCMACQSPENFRKNLVNFNDKMAISYFLSLNINEYQQALKNFTEDQWQEFFKNRSREFQKFCPCNLNAQKFVLKFIYLNVLINCGKKLSSVLPLDITKSDDLEEIRIEFLAALGDNKIADKLLQKFKKDFIAAKQLLWSDKQILFKKVDAPDITKIYSVKRVILK